MKNRRLRGGVAEPAASGEHGNEIAAMVFVGPDLGSLLRGLLDPRAELGRVAAEVNLPFRCAAVFLQVAVRTAANVLRHERTANAAEDHLGIGGADLVEELGVKRL